MLRCDKCGQKFLPTALNKGNCPGCIDRGVPGEIFNPRTIHDATISILQEQIKGSKRIQFRSNLREFIHHVAPEVPDEEIDDEFDRCYIKPDLYELKEEKREVTIYEIEDESCLTVEKLSRICDLFWFLDGFEIDLVLVVCDRYGHLPREIDVSAYSLIFGGKE